jgi:creatinine amidohydrolase
MTDRVLMQELTWPEYEARVAAGAPLLVGVGATEQHGPHLPLGTDALLASELLRRAASALGGIVLPTVTYGGKSQPKSGGGETFPGTLSLDAVHLIGTIRDVLRGCVRHGARRIAILNGHLENQWYTTEAIDLALRDARAEGVHDLVVVHLTGEDAISEGLLAEMFPEGFPGFALEHAARIETSMMAHLFPDLLRADRLARDPRAVFPRAERHPHRLMPVPPSGVLSPAQGYDADYGRRLVDEMVQYIIIESRDAFSLGTA